ncbi:hypothetical protein EG68_01785 [Paragonimus skrjabini miyazakii]|uniref:Uncharacterized protein n=1 Tax=Paragonimus skrjabini miyazakii TaxID=59628 RepID=A0A8S9Z646_9TREM|nr:hypothetical protein EG68_01785 [Paragonimus skrjabini miyazakii]
MLVAPASLGAYNLYAKRASFKDDVVFQQFLLDKPEETPVAAVPVIEQHVPIAPDETEEELPEDELRKREEFKARRRMLDSVGADGLDLKAVLAHRVSLAEGVEEEEEEEDEGGEENANQGESSGDQIKVVISNPEQSSGIVHPCISPHEVYKNSARTNDQDKKAH